jgi:transcriptional regulator with XRE-family HTH domain
MAITLRYGSNQCQDDIANVLLRVILSYMVISEAVRALRKDYGLSQQAFGSKFNMAIASIANYETGARVPDGMAAVKLYRAAAEKQRDDLADAFIAIIYEAMGGMVMPIRNEEERRKVRALQLILFDPRFEHLRRPLNKLLAPVEKHVRESAAFLRLEATDIPGVAQRMIKLQQEQGGTDPWGVGKKAREQGKGKK